MALLVLGIVLSVVTLLLGALAFHLYRKSALLVHSGIQTPGVVVEMVKHAPQSRGQSVWAPVVEYTPRDGRPTRFESELRSYPARFKTGDRVTVVYLDTGERQAEILDFQQLWLGAIMIGILALGALLFAAICFWASTQPNA